MSVQVEQKSYEMPPREGFTVTHFLTVADIERSARYYEKVFGGRILSLGDSKGASGHIQIANTWLIVTRTMRAIFVENYSVFPWEDQKWGRRTACLTP